MSRILAIDFGFKRMGIAVTDPMKIFATGLTTVDSSVIFEFLDNYLKKEPVETIVVGMPLNLDGSETDSTTGALLLLKELKKRYSHINIETEDERFSSRMAMKTMVESGVKKSKRRDKSVIDKVSATIILQSYLEKLK